MSRLVLYYLLSRNMNGFHKKKRCKLILTADSNVETNEDDRVGYASLPLGTRPCELRIYGRYRLEGWPSINSTPCFPSPSPPMPTQQLRRRTPDIQFRVLIIGRANAGKTSILQRICETTNSPIIYRGNERVRGPAVSSTILISRPTRLNLTRPLMLVALILLCASL